MFGGKLRFTLYGIWDDRRSRSGGTGVGDALARWMVPKELRLAARGQGRPVLSLCLACQPRHQPGGSQPGLLSGPLLPPPAGLTGSHIPAPHK